MLAMVANVSGGLPTLVQYWQANQSHEMVGKWLANQLCITNLMPTLFQCQKSDHKLTFSQNCWGMVGKGLTSQHHTANLMPTLGQHWHSDHLLLYPKNSWQMVGNWSDCQCLMLMLAQPIANLKKKFLLIFGINLFKLRM